MTWLSGRDTSPRPDRERADVIVIGLRAGGAPTPVAVAGAVIADVAGAVIADMDAVPF
jgi:trimethylamine:corrinoid methyltransferase-like protein